MVHAEGPGNHRTLVPAVGLTPLRVGERFLYAVSVRMGLRVSREVGEIAEPILTGERPAADKKLRFASTDDVAGEPLLDDASDFGPLKKDVDVVVVGHAHARFAADSFEGGVRVLDLVEGEDGQIAYRAAVSGRFAVRAGAPTQKIPLVAPYLTSVGTSSLLRLAPVAREGRDLQGLLPPDFDEEVFNVAPPELRGSMGSVGPSAILELTGVFEPAAGDREDATMPVTTRVVGLPGLYPVVTFDGANGANVPVRMQLDTLRIDSDARTISVTWRGLAGPFDVASDFHRLVVSMEEVGAERDHGTRLSDTQRGKVVFAFDEDDARDGRTPPVEDARLSYERMKTWGEVAPEPRMPIESYARISAELAEWPKERDKTLDRHGYDEDSFGVEERAWLERFAADAMDGRSQLAVLYGDLFLREQDLLAKPEEDRWTLRDYAGLRVEMDRAADVGGVLEEAEISLAQWMRLERRWVRRAEEDPTVARELDSLLEELEANADPLEDTADEEPEAEDDE
ncbi:MAG: DUF2169 domain-containing protein [Polyangiaceae bacterium]